MNPLFFVYTEFFWRPLFNGLIAIYNALPWHDLGLAIIVLTILIRLAVAPLFWKAQKSQRDLARIQPELKRIQREFKNDRDKQGKAMMELYAREGVNPFSGCLIMFVQLPVLFALLGVFSGALKPENLSYLYAFVSAPDALNATAFGFLNLARRNLYLGVIAALTQYAQIKTAAVDVPPEDEHEFARAMRTQMPYVLPAIIFVSSFTIPAALTLYWTTLNFFGILQEIIVKKWKRRKTA